MRCAGVQFRLDGQNLGAEDTSAPYSASWDTAGATNGPHTLTAIARDRAGNTRTATTVNVTVNNAPPPDVVAPSVSLTAPAAGALLAGSRTLSANASDNVGVAGVQFKRDGQDVGAEDVSAPYSVSWDTTGVADGAHTLTAVARDAAGNTTSATNVDVTVDNTAPSVSVSAPAEGATVGGTVAVNGDRGRRGCGCRCAVQARRPKPRFRGHDRALQRQLEHHHRHQRPAHPDRDRA